MRSIKHILPGLYPSPGNSLRSVQKICGLFDTDLPNEDDLLKSLTLEHDKNDTISLDTSLLASCNEVTLDTPTINLNAGIGDLGFENFFEDFTDLTDYLPEETPKVQILGPVKPVKEKPVKRNLKRQRSAKDVARVTIDHDYSTKKIKKEHPVNNDALKTDNIIPKDQLVDGMSDIEKYHERRRKNNVASKISRATRRQKFASMDIEAEELKIENEILRKKTVELENLAKVMKDMLIQKMSSLK
ncbi:unnamed protein product [Owenia fusiformis]|uniref:BZIP domain-containing protein n=1 Tax=Owenia fusiformis TaxID=6347 RepID=A0A8S4N0K8_OWEFU|nr:unnamed protein product [Owenia fusiformis]